MTAPQNTVFILSDEHNRNVSGCYGHPFIKTPNIDALAARGTRYDSAYCNCPICVPSRASLATGRYVHRTGCWDNAMPYHGQIPSWHHVIRDAGHEVVSIGKLHFRSTDDDNGFSRELLPMHILGGVGDLKGLLRENPEPKKAAENMAREAGVGVSDYFRFDRKIAGTASQWIGEAAKRPTDRPWVLFVSFVMPHFPLIAPQEYYDLYADYDLKTLRHGLDAPAPENVVMQQLRRAFAYDDHFDDARRAVALRAYYGMVTALDDNIGTVVSALDNSGLGPATRIIYASDHGDNLGNRGMWGKSVHYEDSVAVPMIAVGDGFPVATEATPVSLLDMFPTLVESTGVSDPALESELDGRSLFDIAATPDPDRVVFSEYHAVNARQGHFMVRKGPWKLVHYLEGPPQLFNLEDDPGERHDLGEDPAFAQIRADLLTELKRIADPEQISALALSDQAEVIRAHGGEDQILGTRDIPFTPTPAAE
jgi:choline-sulfatase